MMSGSFKLWSGKFALQMAVPAVKKKVSVFKLTFIQYLFVNSKMNLSFSNKKVKRKIY